MTRKKNNVEVIEENGTPVISGTAEAIMGVLNKAIERVKSSPVEIKKAKIKDDLFLEVEYSEEVKDGTNQVKKSCTAPVHDDLKVAFRKLDDHLCKMSEQYNSQGHVDTFDVNCKGFIMTGTGDSEGVMLIGYRGLSNGKYLNLNSPSYKWSDEYEYISELAEIIEECKHEVMLYLFEGKHQPDAQQELPFGEESESEENHADEEL
jgi:hypothetical protein